MTAGTIRTLKLWIPVFLWLALMLAVSSLPGKELPEADIPFADKAAHFAEYLVLGLLMFRAVSLGPKNIVLAKQLILSIIIISAYAAFDEWHQSFIPGRSADVLDFIADAAGAFCGMIIYIIWRRKCRQ